MRQATFCLYYIFKYTELIFLAVWTVLIFSSALWFIDTITAQDELDEKDTQCIAFAIITLVIVLYNLFFNTLLLNIRFYFKMQCVTFGKCIFDAFNICFCFSCLKKPCRDHCCTKWTLAKWVIKAAILGYTISLVQWKVDAWEKSFEVGRLDSVPISHLDIYLMVYLLQHPMFVAIRVPLFLIFTILTCCCDKGAEINDANQFQDSILSLNFIEYELGMLNNFANHPIGRNEWEYNRRLSFVRQQSQREQRELAQAQDPSQSMVQRMQARLGSTVIWKMNKKGVGECTFCFVEMSAGERVIQLKCWPDHQFHERCYNNFVGHFGGQNPGQDLLCPICRAPFKQDDVIKKLLEGSATEKSKDGDIGDIFELSKKASKDSDHQVVHEAELAQIPALIVDENTVVAPDAQNSGAAAHPQAMPPSMPAGGDDGIPDEPDQ